MVDQPAVLDGEPHSCRNACPGKPIRNWINQVVWAGSKVEEVALAVFLGDVLASWRTVIGTPETG